MGDKEEAESMTRAYRHLKAELRPLSETEKADFGSLLEVAAHYAVHPEQAVDRLDLEMALFYLGNAYYALAEVALEMQEVANIATAGLEAANTVMTMVTKGSPN